MCEAFTIYPIYLDSTRKLSKGRKYPLNLCIEKPTHDEICMGLKSLEIEFQSEPLKRHPNEPFVYGRIKVKKINSKKFVVAGLKGQIEELRKNKKQVVVNEEKDEKKGYIKNELGLVPKKKKKGKKK